MSVLHLLNVHTVLISRLRYLSHEETINIRSILHTLHTDEYPVCLFCWCGMNDICITMHCWYHTLPSSSTSVSMTSYHPAYLILWLCCIHRFVALIVEWLVVWSSSRAWPTSKWDLTILLFHGVPQDCFLGCINRIVLWLLLNGSLFDPPQGWLISSEVWLHICCDLRYPMLFLKIVCLTTLFVCLFVCLFVWSSVLVRSLLMIVACRHVNQDYSLC